MKRFFLPYVILSALVAFTCSAIAPNESEARLIMNKMIKSIESHKAYTYTLQNNERIVNMKELRGGEIATKVNVKPLKVYMKMLAEPNKGVEILYVEGERNNKALVNPGKWLPTISLNPYGNLLTKDEHHTILTAAFDVVKKIVSEGMKNADAQGRFDEIFKYAGDVTWNGKACYKIVIEDNTWGYTTYKAVKGENISTIAAKLSISEYSFTELDGIKNYDEDLGGKTLKVPTAYAKKTIFYIDKENNLPIFQEMSDDKGIFERYQFFNLVVDPQFKSNEFAKDFSGYSF